MALAGMLNCVANSNNNLGTRSRTTSYTFDFNSGLMTQQTDADNNIETTYSYDWLGRPTLVTEASNTASARETQTSYEDQARRVVIQKDQNAKGDGLLVQVTDYDPLGRVQLSRQLTNAGAQNPDDDTAGIKVQKRYLYGTSSGTRYELTSNPFVSAASATASSEPTMGWEVTAFDGDGRLLSKQTFDGSSVPAPWGSNANTTGKVTTSYNAQITTVTDQAGNARQQLADGLGRLVEVIEDPGSSAHLNYVTNYSYDALDDLTQVAQGSETRTFSYDSLKRLQSASNPESGTVNYSYDGNGNLLSKKDARAITTNYSYDALNRVTAKSYSDGTTPSVSYGYDTGAAGYPIGRLTQVSNANTVTNYTSYDALGRTTGSNQSQGGQVYSFSYAYNLAGSLTSETYPSGRVVVTSYDGANRATSVTGTFNQAQTNYLANATYSPHGAPTGYTYGNTSMPGFTYNNRLQPNQVYATVPNTNNIDNGAQLFLYYLWLNWGNTTNNGNLLQLDEEVSSAAAPYSSLTTYGENFSYDTVNCLVSASDSGGWTRNFAYDQYGNGWVTGWTGIGLALMEPTSGTLYNTKNQIGSSPYDANGNMETLPPGMTFTYDAENQQTSESNTDGMSATYLYDGDGRRVEKVLASGQTIIYVYDANGDLAAEYDKNPPAPMCRTCYLNYDHLGSIRLVTDQNANIVARHSYLPFGEEVPGGSAGRSSQFDASDNISQRFTGKERDSETSLDYFGARYYGSALGRFTSPDPLAGSLLDPQTLNRYAYVRNNPLSLTDPTGMYICKDDPKDGSSHCASDQDKAFEASRQHDLQSKNKDVARAAAAYGDPNTDNHVNVGFADLGKSGEGGVTRSTLGADANGNLYAQSDVTINSGSKGTALDADVGHEGSHVADAQDMVKSIVITGSSLKLGTDISQYSSEQRAYRVTDSIYRSANEPYYGCADAKCALGAGSSPLGIGGRIDNILLAHPELYHSPDGRPLTSTNQGTNVLNLTVPH